MPQAADAKVPSVSEPGKRRTYLIQGLVTLVVLIAALLVARSLLQSAPSAGSRPAPERQARLVETVRLEATDYQPTVTGWGTLIASRELNLSAQVSGTVEALSPRLQPGLRISPGETLVQLETAPYQTALTQARSALAEAQANFDLEQGQQAVARREFELLSESMSSFGAAGADANAGPPGEILNQGLALRKPQLDIARAAVQAAQARLAEAQLNLDRTTLKAPFEAMVSARTVTLGSQVSASTAIARLVGVETWWLEVLVPSDKLAWLPQADSAAAPDIPGAATAVTLRQPGTWKNGQSRQGTLLRVLPELESEGNLARVLIAIPDPLGNTIPDPLANKPLGQATQQSQAPGPPPRLLLGSFLRADIPGQRLTGVFVLEPAWLRGNNQVWLMDDEGSLRFRTVDILYRDEQTVVISSGLNHNERLVTSRLSTPAEGMPLRTESETDAITENPAPTSNAADDSAAASGARSGLIVPSRSTGDANHG